MDSEKKKLVVLGVLFVAVLGIGAFQFSKPEAGQAPPPQAASTVEIKDLETPTGIEKPEVKNPRVAMELPQRDPFKPGTLNPIDMGYPVPAPTPQPTPRTRPNRGPDVAPIPPFQIAGSLPSADGGSITLDPSAPHKPAEPEFEYQLSGVIVGARPAAVFRDAQGNQRLVPLDGSVDGDSKVVGIEKGRVTVRFRNKTLTLTPGGNAK